MYLFIVSLVVILSNWVCDNWVHRFPRSAPTDPETPKNSKTQKKLKSDLWKVRQTLGPSGGKRQEDVG